MHIGLIGGIGPAATVVYYERLVAAFRARGVPLELTIAHADIDTLVRNADAGDREAQAQVYARHLHQLRGAGATVGAITSIGGSFCHDETAGLSPLPVVDLIAPMDAQFAARGIGCVGLLGTRQVTRSGLYGKMRRTRMLAPADIEAVHGAYVATALAGTCAPEQRALLFGAGQEMVDRGAEAVVLAGTDLGLAFDGCDPGYPVIDAVDLHVEHLADLACGAQTASD